MAYTLPSTSNNLGELFISINSSLNNMVALSVLVVIFFISFALLRKRGAIQGIIGGSFVTLISTIAMASISAAPADWIYIPLVLFAVSVMAEYLKRPDIY